MDLTKEYFDEQLNSLATKNDVTAINKRIDSLPTHGDLEKFATKDDLLELATKNDLASVRSDIAEIKEFVERIDRRTDEDHRAAIHDSADLKHRVSVLEKSAAH